MEQAAHLCTHQPSPAITSHHSLSNTQNATSWCAVRIHSFPSLPFSSPSQPSLTKSNPRSALFLIRYYRLLLEDDTSFFFSLSSFSFLSFPPLLLPPIRYHLCFSFDFSSVCSLGYSEPGLWEAWHVLFACVRACGQGGQAAGWGGKGGKGGKGKFGGGLGGLGVLFL